MQGHHDLTGLEYVRQMVTISHVCMYCMYICMYDGVVNVKIDFPLCKKAMYTYISVSTTYNSISTVC